MVVHLGRGELHAPELQDLRHQPSRPQVGVGEFEVDLGVRRGALAGAHEIHPAAGVDAPMPWLQRRGLI
ncbi:hypothetical protein ASG78_15765 [Nostocoides sp. Soil756]|nr:hypothetical protein ASG78_15765 [Tetrasphaera sp. Soil756]